MMRKGILYLESDMRLQGGPSGQIVGWVDLDLGVPYACGLLL